jgi:hypothetical protein
MRTLDKDCRLSAPSLLEVRRGLSHEAERAHDELGLRVQGPTRASEPKGAHVINWIACHFLALPAEERDRIMRKGKEILDLHCDSDAPVRFGGEVRPRPLPSEEDGGSTARKRRGA